MKKLLAALIVLALSALVFALLHDWDKPPNDPHMMGGPHLVTPAQAPASRDKNGQAANEQAAIPTREEECP